MDNVIDIKTRKPLPQIVRIEMRHHPIIKEFFDKHATSRNYDIQLAQHIIKDLLSTIHTIEIAAHCFAIDDGVLDTEPLHPLNQIIEICKEVSDCE